MKKKYKISALVIFVIIFSSGCDKNPAEYLKLKSVKIAEGSESGGEKSLDDLLEETKEYEKEINSQVQASAKLGPVYEKLGIKYAETKSWDLSYYIWKRRTVPTAERPPTSSVLSYRRTPIQLARILTENSSTIPME